MIKQISLSILLFFISSYVLAQKEKASTTIETENSVTKTDEEVMTSNKSMTLECKSSTQPIYKPSINNYEHQDSLHLPLLNSYGQALPLMSPLAFGGYCGGWYGWGLHKGLNISLGASVFAQFGKHAYHGAGFMESVSAMYAMPITKHLSVAVGGYFNNINWGRYNTQAAGLSAIMGYQFNEKWEAYIYAQKCLTGNRMNYQMPMPMYDYADITDRIGAAVKYNFSPSFSIQLSVERNSYPAWAIPTPINNMPPADNRQPTINP